MPRVGLSGGSGMMEFGIRGGGGAACPLSMYLVWMDIKCLGYLGLETVFVTREDVNMLDVLRLVVTKDYRWGWCCMSMQLVGMNNKVLGYRGLETVLVTREGSGQWVGQGGGGVISFYWKEDFSVMCLFSKSMVFRGEFLDGTTMGLSSGSEMIGVWDGEFVRTRDQAGKWWNWALGVKCVQQD